MLLQFESRRIGFSFRAGKTLEDDITEQVLLILSDGDFTPADGEPSFGFTSTEAGE